MAKSLQLPSEFHNDPMIFKVPLISYLLIFIFIYYHTFGIWSTHYYQKLLQWFHTLWLNRILLYHKERNTEWMIREKLKFRVVKGLGRDRSGEIDFGCEYLWATWVQSLSNSRIVLVIEIWLRFHWFFLVERVFSFVGFEAAFSY